MSADFDPLRLPPQTRPGLGAAREPGCEVAVSADPRGVPRDHDLGLALVRVHRSEQARLLREVAAARIASSGRGRALLGALAGWLLEPPRGRRTFACPGSWFRRARVAVALARRDGIAVPRELTGCLWALTRARDGARVDLAALARARAPAGIEGVPALLRRAEELDPDPESGLLWGVHLLLQGQAADADRAARGTLRDPRLPLDDGEPRQRVQLQLLRALACEELGRCASALAPLERASRALVRAGHARAPLLDAVGLSLALAAGELHAARVAAVRLAAAGDRIDWSARAPFGQERAPLGSTAPEAADGSARAVLACTLRARLRRRPAGPPIAASCAGFARRLLASRNALGAAVVRAVTGSDAPEPRPEAGR